MIHNQGQGPQNHLSSVKLPKLEIPTFSGDKMRWSEFWDSFKATVDDNTSLTDIEKLNYLNLLKGKEQYQDCSCQMKTIK